MDIYGMFTSSPTWRLKMHVLCKVGKNIIIQNKTLLVMFYRQHKTLWYQFCHFKHFLRAEKKWRQSGQFVCRVLLVPTVTQSHWVTWQTNWHDRELYTRTGTFWYQLWIFQHVLLAENSEDGFLASSCVEFCIGLSCNSVWDLVTIGTRVLYWSVISANGHCTASQYSARTPYWTSMYTNQPKNSS